jgi:hypothetical protein
MHQRLANGALVRRAVPGGLGQLTSHNGNDQDAVVSLVRGSGSVAALALYVRAKSSATTTSVADGTYQVYYTLGFAGAPVHAVLRFREAQREHHVHHHAGQRRDPVHGRVDHAEHGLRR